MVQQTVVVRKFILNNFNNGQEIKPDFGKWFYYGFQVLILLKLSQLFTTESHLENHKKYPGSFYKINEKRK